MKTEGKLDKQLNIRASASDVQRLERVAAALTARTAGVTVNRSAAGRAAILKGLDVLEEELGLKSEVSTSRKAAKRS